MHVVFGTVSIKHCLSVERSVIIEDSESCMVPALNVNTQISVFQLLGVIVVLHEEHAVIF